MAVSSKTIREPLLRLKSCLPGGGLGRRYAVDEPPLRSELLSADQMEQHGKTLAGSHQLSLGGPQGRLLERWEQVWTPVPRFAERCAREASELRRNIEEHGWDGEWYRRAYFDDGSPLGSTLNPECRIDSISQSWSVLSGAGDAARARLAMEAVDQRLVRREQALIQLLDPPFDKSDLNPGYIKGYVPGVRENGGQYTHAAIWAAMAFAALGDRERAWELLALINPVNHARSPEGIAIYKVEPYVVAADVYALSPHTGRGGWTWYTGSAGWMYRLIVESLLGLRLEVDKLRFTPCLPADWPGFTMHYRYRETVYHIAIQRPPAENGETHVTFDGVDQTDNTVPLVDDRQEHSVEVSLPVVRSQTQN